MTPSPMALPGGALAYVPAGLSLARRAMLGSASDPQSNPLVQDVAVVSANRSDIVVFESHNGYQPRTITLPGSQQVVRLTEASTTLDEYEDFMVLTVEASLWRVICIQQHADPSTGFGGTPQLIEFLRFNQPFPDSSPRAFEFDLRARSLAEGFLLFDDNATISGRGEIRFVQPTSDPTATLGVRVLGMKLVRSPIAENVSSDLDVIVTDSNGDGLVEIVGGQTTGLRRVNRSQR